VPNPNLRAKTFAPQQKIYQITFMDPLPPTISKQLEEEIIGLIQEKPEIFAQSDDPRSAAGKYLAHNKPDAFDTSNPVDRLLLKLESSNQPLPS